MVATAAEDDFRALVRRMRELQVKYFRTRDATAIRECRDLERRVDAALEPPDEETVDLFAGWDGGPG